MDCPRPRSRIAVLGGGPMGLAVAYELTRMGHQPVVYEAEDRLGGMAATFPFAGLRLERYYHFHCRSDRAFFALLDALSLGDRLRWRPTRMGLFYQGRLYPWGTAGAVLAFPHLSLLDRLRCLAHAARCLTMRDWRPLDALTATAWLKTWLGERAYGVLWRPLFAYKFFHHSDQVSAAWIWSRIRRVGQSRRRLRETLGYLEGGSQVLIDALAAAIRQGGGEIALSTPVGALRPQPGGGALLTTASGEERFAQVISTIPLPLVAPLLERGGCDPSLVRRYADQPSLACACVVVQTRRAISGNFWTNVHDPRFAIPGVIELGHLRPLPVHVTYVPFYMPADHPDYQRPDQAFIEAAWRCLQAIQPSLVAEDLLASHCSRYRFAQPVCGTHFQATLPPLQPFPGVFTADTTAYYPEDRGISESIGFGRALARRLVAEAP